MKLVNYRIFGKISTFRDQFKKKLMARHSFNFCFINFAGIELQENIVEKKIHRCGLNRQKFFSFSPPTKTKGRLDWV